MDEHPDVVAQPLIRKRSAPSRSIRSQPWLLRYVALPSETKHRPTSKEIWQTHIPGTISVASYSLLGAHILDKTVLPRLFGKADVAVGNCLLFNTHIGLGIYLYFSKPISDAPLINRIIYSAYGSVMVNFFSLLVWASLRQTCAKLPRSACVAVALLSGFGILGIGRDLLAYVNACVAFRGMTAPPITEMDADEL